MLIRLQETYLVFLSLPWVDGMRVLQREGRRQMKERKDKEKENLRKNNKEKN